MNIRQASMNDAEIVLEWRNDETTRNNSFSKDVIDFETHKKWFRSKLEDESCFMYILEDASVKAGQIRIDKVNDVGEISYTIAPTKRGQGYGKKIISMLEDVIPTEIKVLMGLVEEQNVPSKKCFIANGYAEFFGGVLVAL